MLSRRNFLMQVPAASALVAGAAGQSPSRIRQVDIVHHTHTDIGYTELPSVVRDLQRRYLDIAIDTCARDKTFRWTVESLVGLDDWWKASPPARRSELTNLVKAGRMDVMGMPFNQTPFLNAMQWRQMMRWIPTERWKSLGIRAAMQNDVNGLPRAGAMALLDHGINHFLMGLNSDSGGPPFRRPDAFWWKMPDGRRLFVWLGEHYGSVMAYLQAARDGTHMVTEEPRVRAAHAGLTKRLQAIESEGYALDRLILTFTHPLHYDNGSPFPSLAPFVEAWNKLALQPALNLTTATEAVFAMEKAVGSRIPEMEGEWTDWWANGDASSPREVAASRVAKRYMTTAFSSVFGPMPERAQPGVEQILKDLCLFDEHTWGASASISRPYGLETLGQFVEKSDLAFRPMGMAEILLSRRLRALIDPMPEGIYAVNPASVEISGWAALHGQDTAVNSLVDAKTGARSELYKERGASRFWLEKMGANSVRAFRGDRAAATDTSAGTRPAVSLDSLGWPMAASWNGMKQPLFEGPLGDFICVGVVPPADRRTLAQLHGNPDPKKREAIRKASLNQTPASYASASSQETAHTLLFAQDIRHERIANGRRTLELWKREPRARIVVRFDRLSSLSPEVLFLGFTLPEGSPLPVFSSGGVPFTPYRDQLRGSCRDYFAIDGWADFPGADGHRLWVTRDAPLVAVGSPHVVELHQAEPANPRSILAMVFDNCWHTNFVADSHGTFEFQFDMAWKSSLDKPADLAAALTTDPVAMVNPAFHETEEELNHLFRP